MKVTLTIDVTPESVTEDKVYGAAAPTTGAHVRNEIVWNSEPESGAALGWVCVADGTPGTWIAFAELGEVEGHLQMKVSSNDTTPGYLNGKLVAGPGITLTEGSDGGDETLTASLTTMVTSGSCTLSAGTTTTTVSNSAVTAASKILLFPTSANAAADVGSATGVYVSAKNVGASFVVTHPNNANEDKTFDYVILG